MDFKVNYNIILETGNDLAKQVEDLDSTLKHMLSLIEELKKYWSGIDSIEFGNNSSVYIKNLKFNIDELNFLSNFIKVASKAYSEKDLGWGKKMKEVGVDKEWTIG